MTCGRCDEPIEPGQPSSEHSVETMSGFAPPVRWHLVCPVKPPLVKRYP